MKKNKPKKILSRICRGVLSLTNFTFFTIGFGSWMISDKVSSQDSFELNADGDCNSLNVVFQPIERFTYDKNGTFLSTKGDVFIKFRITDAQSLLKQTSKNYVPIIPILSDSGSFGLVKYATSSPQCLLNDYSYPTRDKVLSSSSAQATFSEGNRTLEFADPIQFTPSGSYIYGGVIYHFDFSNVSNFNSEIYSNRPNTSFKFTLEATE